jgi:hypothetical protein
MAHHVHVSPADETPPAGRAPAAMRSALRPGGGHELSRRPTKTRLPSRAPRVGTAWNSTGRTARSLSFSLQNRAHSIRANCGTTWSSVYHHS